MIKLNACIPVDDVRDDYPAAVYQQVVVANWDEWRHYIDFHGIRLWQIITKDYPPLPQDMQDSLDDSEAIIKIGALHDNMFKR